MATDVLGFATRGTKSAPKAVLSSNGTQKDINAFKKNAGVLSDAIGQGADDSYTRFVKQQQQKLQQAKQQQQAQAQQQQVQAQQQKAANSPIGKAKSLVSNFIVKPVVNTAKAAGDTAAQAADKVTGNKQAAANAKKAASTAYDNSAAKAIASPFTSTAKQIGKQVSYLAGPVATDQQRKSLLDTQKKAASSPNAPIINKSAKQGDNTAQGLIKAEKQVTQGKDSKTVAKTLLVDKQKKQAQDRKAAGTATAIATDVLGGGSIKEGVQAAKLTKMDLATQAAKTGNIAAVNNAASTESSNPNAKPIDLANAAVQGLIGGSLLHVAGHFGGQPLRNVIENSNAAKTLVKNHQTQSLLAKATADTAEKNTAAAAKIDQKIELINAKKADDKFTNVDKIKVQQLKAEKAQLTPATSGSAVTTTPAPAVSGEVTRSGTQTIPQPVAAKSEASGASVTPNGPPTIKAYGREIPLTEENGYKATETPSGTLYSKVARTGRNNKDSNFSMNYYDANGNKLTHEQAQAVQNGSLRLAPKAKPATVETLPTKTKTNVQTPKTEKPVAPAIVEPIGTRTLKPSETAHMAEIGGYTHSEHMAQDYADMLRGQEQAAKGGQIVKNADGTYKRTSEHSHFYRDFYKENGKAPTKADYLEQAKKELESNKDGIGAGEDYKKLLEREAKPVLRVQVESTVKDVPQGTSKVAQRIAKDIKEQYGDLAQYDRINIKDQAAKAEQLLSNRDELDKVISGEKPLPDGLRATSVITAVRNDPELVKDAKLLKRLASSPLASESSLSAQELRLARENAKNDPVMAIRDIQKTRQAALEKKTGKTIAQHESDDLKAVRAAKPKVTKETWSSFVESIKC